MSPTLGVQRARCLSVSLSVCQSVSLSVCQSVSLSVCLYIYISYVRHFWSRGPRATRKRKPAHLKFKGHMHACMLYTIICSKRQPGHHYTYRASTHVQQLSDNQQRRLEAETTHEREERLQQLSAAQITVPQTIRFQNTLFFY